METLIVDTKGGNTVWSKRWSTLREGHTIPVIEPSTISEAIKERNDPLLIVAHDSAFASPKQREKFEKSIAGDQPICFVLYVSHSGRPLPKTLACGRIHYSGVAFRQDDKLTALGLRLQKLSSNLEVCCSSLPVRLECLGLAWGYWEDEASDFLEALWGLCQAYLAATINASRFRESHHLDLGEYAEASDWAKRYVSALSGHFETLRVSASPASSLEDVSSTAFWTVPGPAPDLPLLRAEWGVGDFTPVVDLLQAIRARDVSTAAVLPAFEALQAWVHGRLD